ncbi:acylneuraminate cytidylyltransferase family protein [Virgibacillus senegalensis]|uniref:acylneuraminate cytidylyltransferase family protein n=1 Tax=Virgibacillus senegalensis TaxID=1499679 RepID=UPI00069E3D30|nr:acylneuraminate cytidylyltransferase family protein [Virgibacillus senegalensis]
MLNGKTFLAVIPARGGSKGIPRKNLTFVNRKPLIQYTIEEALTSEAIDDVIVSTDDQDIADVSIKLGASVPFLRPPELAGDHSKTIDAVMHVINEQRNRYKEYSYVVILQPTQPLRKSWHIDEAALKIIENGQNGLVSISKVVEHPVLMRTISSEGRLKNVLNINSTLRRQDFPDVYKVNGAIYINKISSLSNQTSLNDNEIGYIMDEKYDLDIDKQSDIEELLRRVKV